jgi:hypothetical protein
MTLWVMNGPRATSAVSPFELRTLVGALVGRIRARTDIGHIDPFWITWWYSPIAELPAWHADVSRFHISAKHLWVDTMKLPHRRQFLHLAAGAAGGSRGSTNARLRGGRDGPVCPELACAVEATIIADWRSRGAEQRYFAAMLEDAIFWIAIAVTVAGLVGVTVSIARG